MKTLAGLDYQERGAGAVVCLVHAGVFGAWFEPVFDQPALDRFRLIRPIRPGYGGSRAPSEPASLAAQASQCGELLRRLGVEHAYWVGHSSSCCIALVVALEDPDLVAGLVLFEPAKPHGPLREAAARTYVGPALAAARQGDAATAFGRVPTRRRGRRLPGRDQGSVWRGRPRGGRAGIVVLLRRRIARRGGLDLRTRRGDPGHRPRVAAPRRRDPTVVP